MNNKPQYTRKGSIKNTILRTLCLHGAIPYNKLHMFPFSKRSLQKAVREMKEDGVVDLVYSNGPVRTRKRIILLKDFRSRQRHFSKGLPSDFVKAYLDHGASVAKNIQYAKPVTRDRLCSNIETAMFFHWASIPSYVDERPDITTLVSEYAFYPSRDVKRCSSYADLVENTGDDTKRKVSGSRMTGLFTSPGGAYCVFNIQGKAMKLSSSGEIKMKRTLDLIMARSNYGEMKRDACIVLCKDDAVIAHILTREMNFAEKGVSSVWSFDALSRPYENILLIPKTAFGRALLQILGNKDWKRKILDAFFTKDEQVTPGTTRIPADAYDRETDTYTIMGALCNLSLLKPFLQRAKEAEEKERFRIICFEEQAELFEEVAGEFCTIEYIGFTETLACAGLFVCDEKNVPLVKAV